MATKNKNKPELNPLQRRLAEIQENIQKSAQTDVSGDNTDINALVATPPREQQIELFVNASERLWSELNFARNTDLIFCSPRSKKIGEARVRRAKDSEDFIAVAPATIFSNNGRKQELRTPTVISAGIFFAVLQLWEQQGRRPDGWVLVSVYEIFKILGKQPGKAAYETYRRELSTLKNSQIKFKNSYVKKDKIEKIDDEFSLFSRVLNKEEILDSSLGGGRTEKTAIQISSAVVNGILSGYVKPFLFKEYLEIAADSYDAAILYFKLDLYMSSKETGKPWLRKVSELLPEIGIDGARYKLSAKRKEKAEELARILDGRRVSNGRITLSVTKGKNEPLLRVVRMPFKEPRVLEPTNNLSEKDVEYLTSELVKWVGFPTEKTANYKYTLAEMYARKYSARLIEDTLSLFRADALNDATVKDKIAMYTGYLHREVHRRGLAWLGECAGENCKYQKDLLG